MDEVISELRWLIENSDGVLGLQSNGEVMAWEEVLTLYMPATARARLPTP